MAKNIRVKNKKEKYETICIVLLFAQVMLIASCIAIMIYETMFSTFSIEGLAASIMRMKIVGAIVILYGVLKIIYHAIQIQCLCYEDDSCDENKECEYEEKIR